MDPYIPKPLDIIGNYATLEKLRQGDTELGLRQQELQQRAADSKSLQDYRNAQATSEKFQSVIGLIRAGQEDTAQQLFNNDPELIKRAGGPIKIDAKEELIHGANGFIGKYNRRTGAFEVQHDPTKALGPADE